jgi:hypothetical protein
MKFWTKTSESFSSPYWIKLHLLRHSERIAIFLKKIEKKREYVTRIIQPLSVYDFISDERKITTDIILVRGYVPMFICKDLQT